MSGEDNVKIITQLEAQLASFMFNQIDSIKLATSKSVEKLELKFDINNAELGLDAVQVELDLVEPPTPAG